MGIWVILCVQKPSHHILRTFRPPPMFKIVLCDSSLYPKQLSLFFLLRLISASGDCIGYITNLCSMIKLLHELKNSSFQHRSIQVFDNVSVGKKENWKFAGLLYITKNLRFSYILYAHSQFFCSLVRFDLANQDVRQPVQQHSSMLNCSYSTRH